MREARDQMLMGDLGRHVARVAELDEHVRVIERIAIWNPEVEIRAQGQPVEQICSVCVHRLRTSPELSPKRRRSAAKRAEGTHRRPKLRRRSLGSRNGAPVDLEPSMCEDAAPP